MEEESACEPLPILNKEIYDTDALLAVQGLSFEIDKKSILKDLSFEIGGEGITAVLGANGSGKSTLLRLLAGFLEPTDGKIFFEGESVLGPNQKLVAGHEEIALVRQDNRLFPLHTVKENLNHILRDEFEDVKTHKIEQLSELLGLKHNLNRILKFLSGGEQQRVAIAAALASNPKLLLMDEPFSQTDMYLKQELKGYLVEIVNQLKIHILFVSHEPQDALALANNILILSEGKLIESGQPKDLYYYPKTKTGAMLTGVCNWLPINLLNGKFDNLHKIGDEVLVRSDQIHLFEKVTSDSWSSEIIKVEFCGFFQNVFLKSEELKTTLITTQPTHQTYKVGQTIWFKL